MKPSIVLNGKFLSGPATGVQRVATEMIKALDKVVAQNLASRISGIELLTPHIDASHLHLQNILTSRSGNFTGIPWEQFDLPRLANGRLVINLANLGPVILSHSMTMIHDAQTYISPNSYSFAFRKWYGAIQPILGRRNHKILTVSEFSKQQLIKYGVAGSEKISVIHNGVDHILHTTANTAAVANFGLYPRQFVLGLANTQPHKNIVVLIRAFESECLKNLELVLFGASSASALETLYGDKLPRNIRVIGSINDDDLRGLLESALCIGFPSLTEGFGLPPLEAMLVGCPALVAPCGALPEVCGSAALYVNPFDSQAWAKNILNLIESPDFWSEMSAAGIAQASRYRWETSATQLLEIASQYN